MGGRNGEFQSSKKQLIGTRLEIIVLAIDQPYSLVLTSLE